ncbi:nose resistant to fluoxetine protein 6-like isoform X2 [Apis laboriosa]|nr:nose resistant to fluoxetine protein 6-like isoform X2 [Apis laboriosa]
MNKKALVLLTILQLIHADRRSTLPHPSDCSNWEDEKIDCADQSHEACLARIDRSRNECAINVGSPNGQCCAAGNKGIETINLGSNYERRSEFPLRTELMSDVLRFTPNFTFVQTVECREQVNVFLRELSNYKLWAMEMLDSNAKLPSSLLQGNLNQFGDFDQCLNVMAHEMSSGREIKIQGRYFLTNIDIDATHPITENLVSTMKAYNLFTSRLHEERGHFFPKFPVIRWALCLPSVCSNEDARSVIQHTLNSYNSTVGIKFMVRVDPNMSYVKSSSSYAKETIYVLCFFAIVACLVAATTMRDYLMTREREKENSLERIAMGFSLRRTAKSLFKKETGPNDITCIHGMKSILAILIYYGHNIMITSVMPYMNRIYYVNMACNPLTITLRIATMYTDSFLLFSGTLTSFNMMHELTVTGEIRWFRRLVSRYVRLTPMLLVVVLYYAYVMEHSGSGPEWNIIVKNADLCKNTGWMNLLYAQIALPFEDQCASHTYQLSVDMQLSLLAPALIFVLKFWSRLGIFFVLFIASLSTIFRYTILLKNNVTIIFHHGFSMEEFYTMSNLMYIIPFYRITPYIFGVVLSVLLYRVGKNVKIPK